MGNLSDAKQSGLYPLGYRLVNEFDLDPGVCVLPLAEDPPEDQAELLTWSPVVILRLHAPYRTRKVNYGAVKQNNPPFAPAPGDTGKFVYVGGSMQFSNVMNGTYTTFDWSVEGTYEYVENCVSRNRDGFVLGMGPWVWGTTSANLTNTGGIPSQPSAGAVGGAGQTVRLGAYMGNNATLAAQQGQPWVYNSPEFYPGSFLTDDLTNGGKPPNQYASTSEN